MNFTNNTVTNTGTTAATGNTSGGAAVYNKGSNVVFNDVGFTGNTVTSTSGALSNGGAVFVDAIRNKHSYEGIVTFNISKDMTYSGNKVVGTNTTYSDTYGSVSKTSGGFLYLDRGATANFNISKGATLTIGEEGVEDENTDSIASSIKKEGEKYSENAINKTGEGTLTVNGQMKDYHGDLNVKEGTMNINSSLASDSVVSVSKGATLNLKSLALSTTDAASVEVVSPSGSKTSVQTPEKSGELSVEEGGTATAETITASGKSKITLEENSTLNVTDTITMTDTATAEVGTGATVTAENGIKLNGNSSLNTEHGAVVTGDVYVSSDDVKVTGSGSYEGSFKDANGNALSTDRIQKVLGIETNAKSESQLANGDHTVKMIVDENGNLTFQSTEIGKEGAVTTTEMGTWDKEGNYDANGNDITNVDTLEVNKITLGGNDLQETLDEQKATDDWLGQRISKEIADRLGADAAQDRVINQLNQNMYNGFQTINQNMATINQNVYDGFVALNEADAKERADRIAADEVLQQNIDNETAARIESNNTLNTRINQVEKDANKGIAKTAALAALHPLDYDPDNKFDIAAAGGFYKGENAFALGAFYRPNRDIMLSLGTSVSGDDNAYNVGVSFKVGKSGKHTEAGVSTAELYAMIGAMQEKMDAQQKRIEELEASLAK